VATGAYGKVCAYVCIHVCVRVCVVHDSMVAMSGLL
jgi:hypothetical protein